MKKYLVLILIMLTGSLGTIPAASAKSGCTEPVPQVFKRVSPAVVFISAISFDPFREKDRLTTSVGSGFFIGNDGLILTNSHLVFGHQTISVTLDNGYMTEAQLVGTDPILDLALLRIPPPTTGLSIASLGDSGELETGEDVMAIGNPFGLEQTLTVGVISGVNRTLTAVPMSIKLPLIQTDAAINPGNSGGPLVNRCGEVIGINTAMLGEAENIGFAVPINVAKQVLPQLVEKGRVVRPWIGVGGKFIEKELGRIINLPMADGFMVETIDPESPAEKAGLNEGELPVTIGGTEFLFGGDIIIAINGKTLDDPEKMERLVSAFRVGERVRLTLFYAGESREVELRLTERPILPGDL